MAQVFGDDRGSAHLEQEGGGGKDGVDDGELGAGGGEFHCHERVFVLGSAGEDFVQLVGDREDGGSGREGGGGETADHLLYQWVPAGEVGGGVGVAAGAGRYPAADVGFGALRDAREDRELHQLEVGGGEPVL